MTSSGKIELMAPAGSFESSQAALDNGADSVYFGVEQLNMRARSSINFTLDDLQEISQRCKEKHVRTYPTLNTIMTFLLSKPCWTRQSRLISRP